MKNVIIPSGPQRSLAFYLAMEEYMAREFSDDVFFTWRVPPTVIIGRNQVLENEVNLPFCRSKGIKVFRRRSGGGCVYADYGNIMLSYVSGRTDAPVLFDRYLSELASALSSLGLPAEKSGRNDILIEGRKVSGNAFQQLPSRSIVHGTLLYSADHEMMAEAIRPPLEKLGRHGVESVRQRVMNIADYISGTSDPRTSDVESLENYMRKWFCEGEVLLTEEQLAGIERIEKEYIELQ
jgi:lipoyltransferase/lipoate-protein ligase